jgi:hypothetical protein
MPAWGNRAQRQIEASILIDASRPVPWWLNIGLTAQTSRFINAYRAHAGPELRD